MTAQTELPTLVALSPAGDVFVTSRYGRSWLHVPGAEPCLLAEADVARVIDRADLVRAGQQYETWLQLQADLQHRVSTTPTVQVDTSSWDAADVHDMLLAAADFEAEGAVHDARSLLRLLAGLPVVRADDTLHSKVLDALMAQVSPRVTAHTFVSQSRALVAPAMRQLAFAA